jgi:Xaa-Pro aminopeptidase
VTTPPRWQRVGERVRDAGLDALLVTDLTNVRWLTGFTGSSGWLVLTPDDLTLVTDGRYGEQATSELATNGCGGAVVEARSRADQLDRLASLVASMARVGVEARNLTLSEFESFRVALAPELVSTTGVVEGFRRTKDDGEVELMAAACRIADEVLAGVAPMLWRRPTEADVRDELEYRMRRLGAQGPSYDTIVATGPQNASRPHHRPTARVIEEGHTVVIDVGALVQGYHSDMTRTFLIGEPTPVQREVYEVVAVAQQAGLDEVRPGLPLQELDAACRRVISDAGFGEWFSHGTGHGVGLLIHEDPFVNATATGVLQVGDVVTVEPGVYRVGLGGIRIEDLVLVTPDGHRRLTHSPKDPTCPPSPPTT